MNDQRLKNGIETRGLRRAGRLNQNDTNDLDLGLKIERRSSLAFIALYSRPTSRRDNFLIGRAASQSRNYFRSIRARREPPKHFVTR